MGKRYLACSEFMVLLAGQVVLACTGDTKYKCESACVLVEERCVVLKKARVIVWIAVAATGNGVKVFLVALF